MFVFHPKQKQMESLNSTVETTNKRKKERMKSLSKIGVRHLTSA